MKVVISFDEFRSKKFTGFVRSVLPRDDDFLIQVTANELPSNILPGMSADLSIEIGQKKESILIPTKAISNGFIILLKNKKKEKVKVDIGISDAEYTEILSPVLHSEDSLILPKIEKN